MQHHVRQQRHQGARPPRQSCCQTEQGFGKAALSWGHHDGLAVGCLNGLAHMQNVILSLPNGAGVPELSDGCQPQMIAAIYRSCAVNWAAACCPITLAPHRDPADRVVRRQGPGLLRTAGRCRVRASRLLSATAIATQLVAQLKSPGCKGCLESAASTRRCAHACHLVQEPAPLANNNGAHDKSNGHEVRKPIKTKGCSVLMEKTGLVRKWWGVCAGWLLAHPGGKAGEGRYRMVMHLH